MQTGLLPPHIVQILDMGQDITITELVKQLRHEDYAAEKHLDYYSNNDETTSMWRGVLGHLLSPPFVWLPVMFFFYLYYP